MPKRDVPRFIDLYRRGALPLEPMITDRIALDDLNAAFDATGRGDGARSVLVFGGA